MYTDRLLDHYRNPRNKGHLDAPDLAAFPHDYPVAFKHAHSQKNPEKD
jgi:NifU-like protein involved in Fe-S cluster formation